MPQFDASIALKVSFVAIAIGALVYFVVTNWNTLKSIGLGTLITGLLAKILPLIAAAIAGILGSTVFGSSAAKENQKAGELENAEALVKQASSSSSGSAPTPIAVVADEYAEAREKTEEMSKTLNEVSDAVANLNAQRAKAEEPFELSIELTGGFANVLKDEGYTIVVEPSADAVNYVTDSIWEFGQADSVFVPGLVNN